LFVLIFSCVVEKKEEEKTGQQHHLKIGAQRKRKKRKRRELEQLRLEIKTTMQFCTSLLLLIRKACCSLISNI